MKAQQREKKAAYSTIDEYIQTCTAEIQPILQKVRETVKNAAPLATEKIAWAMPTFYQNGNLVHFMAHKKHIGFYPGASGIEHFAEEFKQLGYSFSKGAVQFPYNKPIPYDLIEKIVLFRVSELK